ncbi:hypothetical protein E3C22_06910 [Jiella endophytica]|uniref:HEAT repeat domain-containing protein n=1 Tax=Jiella endophytica TaxID=2558362 RepID=A0A4Y8RPW3_9HYPH|nr:hypothetical protein [Jiella endophytica]TFF25105.1 hypothetical protein E3C22_06910 [Jiella endophytica]
MKWLPYPSVFSAFLLAMAVTLPGAAQQPAAQRPAIQEPAGEAPPAPVAEKSDRLGNDSPDKPETPPASAADAASTPTNDATAGQDEAAVDSQAAERFLEDPGALLDLYPEGGAALTEAVRRLAVADERTLDGILSLAKTADPRLQAAIGRGLAKAAVALAAKDPKRAARMQQRVAASGIDTLQTAFRVEQNDVETAVVRPRLTGGGDAPPAGRTTASDVIRIPNAGGTVTAGSEPSTSVSASAAPTSTTAPPSGGGSFGGGDSLGFLAGLVDNNKDDTSPSSPTR